MTTVDPGVGIDGLVAQPRDGRHRARGEDIEREAVVALDALRLRTRDDDRPEPVLLEHVEHHHVPGRLFRKGHDEETRRPVGRGWMIAEYVADSASTEQDAAPHRVEVFLLDDGSYAIREAGSPNVEGPFVECPGWSSGADFWVQVRDNCTAAPEPHRHRHGADMSIPAQHTGPA